MKIVNLTPHAINILTENHAMAIIASGEIARCKTERKVIGDIDGIPVTSTVFGEVEGLPEPQEGTIYIVSSLVAQACRDRNDVFIPDDTVRDDEGKIIGCRSLGRI
jgi:hypothetical protein